MNTSTIPAPVAAELSGVGSFFGSCQIAASGFESFLQSASEMPCATDSADGGLIASLFSGNHNSNEVLKQLQEILGEETGENVFKIMTDFLKEYKPLAQAQGSIANSNDTPESLTVFHLLKFLDPEYLAEAPIAKLKEELESILEEIKAILGYEQAAQPETEAVQPEAEILQPKPETVQQETEIPQPEMEIPQPKTEIAQSETEIPQPKPETVQPETEIPQPKLETVQPETEIPQPKAETPQPEIEILLSKTETVQQETKTEDKKIPIKLYDAMLLSKQMGMEPEEYQEFFEFMHDLLKQGLINFDEFDKAVNPPPEVLGVTEEKKEPNFFNETFKELWEYVKNEDEPKKEEIISMLKQIAEIKETVKELKSVSSMEQKTSSETPKVSETSEKEVDLKFANSEPVKSKNNKHGEEKQVQPEVRAVWEGGGLKIELVNPKTGEKLESAQTATPQNMQEKMQEFEVIKQVVAKAKFITTSTGEQRLTIQLRPEHLGQLDLRIILNRGEMQIHARVESATAQQALENHIGLLREGLEKQGITLERLEISIEQKDKQDAWSLAEKQEQHEQKQGNRRHRHGREAHLAVSIANDANGDTGRRLGYNTMEYLA